MLLTELLTRDRVVIPLVAVDKPGVLAELTRHLVERAGGDFEPVFSAVSEREALLSTAIGLGVAIPHAKAPGVAELAMIAGTTRTGVPFDAIDGDPVRLFFLIVGPDSSAGLHVKILSRIARLVRRDAVRRELTEAPTPDAFCRALHDAEER